MFTGRAATPAASQALHHIGIGDAALASWRILAVNASMDLRAALEKRFRAEAAAHVDTVFELATDRATLLTFSVRAGQLRFEADARPDVTFTFAGCETARAIIVGDADPIAAFMAGRFRSDGHLPLAFVLLSLFRHDYAGPPPP